MSINGPGGVGSTNTTPLTPDSDAKPTFSLAGLAFAAAEIDKEDDDFKGVQLAQKAREKEVFAKEEAGIISQARTRVGDVNSATTVDASNLPGAGEVNTGANIAAFNGVGTKA